MRTWLLRLFQRKRWTQILDRACYLFVLTDYDPARKEYVKAQVLKHITKLGVSVSPAALQAILTIAERRCKRRMAKKKAKETSDGGQNQPPTVPVL